MTGTSPRKRGAAPGMPKLKRRAQAAMPTTVTFDEESCKVLDEMRRNWNFNSIEQTLSAAVRMARGLQDQANKGYTQIIVQNPRTGEQRMLVMNFIPVDKPLHNTEKGDAN